MRSFRVVVLAAAVAVVGAIALLTVATAAVSAQQPPQQASRPPAGGPGVAGGGGGGPPVMHMPQPPRKKRYNELIDLMLDIAKPMCSRLGRLIRGKDKRTDYAIATTTLLSRKEERARLNDPQAWWRGRCDVLYDGIERNCVYMGDTMVRELDLTQRDLVDAALMPQHFHSMVAALKQSAKLVLQLDVIKEHDLDLLLHQQLTSFILKAATQDQDMAQHMKNLPRAANRNAREAGIAMPTYGQTDTDDMDEENYLTGQDLQWAQSQRGEGADEDEVTAEPVYETTDEEDEQMIDDLSKENWLIE